MFSVSGLRLYFPKLELPPGFRSLSPGPPAAASQASCSFARPAPQYATSLGPPAAALPRVLSAQLPVSAPPTSLDECFFFNSLVVGLPYSSIFCQFWLFLFLNCCCPSFGCGRKLSVSAYASILAEVPIFFLYSFLPFSFTVLHLLNSFFLLPFLYFLNFFSHFLFFHFLNSFFFLSSPYTIFLQLVQTIYDLLELSTTYIIHITIMK